ncbi:ABC transporter ATP-binding protein [Ensifer sp. ENS01]|uniref:ABC transporter ATP-binding protein n=1 Tax=Ensifer sp. ENS01 TaxID=2769293 RepID=UPI000DE10A81|nr:ABC transporter ATP-binding protein [Ensifer sp. ENS01]MBD9497754.1 ABC transporter ATP-binding protein [Ensifer sp. ENS01]
MAANSNDDPQSEFFLAAQEFARALGVDVEVLLAQYLQEATDTAAADPDCLKSTEIQLFLQDGVLAADRIAHIENCMACTAMAETIVPEGSNLADYLSSAKLQAEERLQRNKSTWLQSRLSIDGRIVLQGVTRRVSNVAVVDDLNLSVESGEICALLGPKGSGTSIVLRMIAGLEPVDAGSVILDGTDVTHIPAGRRRVASVLDSASLQSHLSVGENIASAFEFKRTYGARALADEIVVLLDLEGVMGQTPASLSDAQRARVVLARALVSDPRLLLFDSRPLKGDISSLWLEIAELHRELGPTMVISTHDQAEAMRLADRICVLLNGRVLQTGRPEDLYKRPDNRAVAGLIGYPQMNFLPVTTLGNTGNTFSLSIAGVEDITVSSRFPIDAATPAPHAVGIRPEHVLLTDLNSSGVELAGTVVAIARAGDTATVTVATDAGQVIAGGTAAEMGKIGERIGLILLREQLHVFAEDGRAI